MNKSANQIKPLLAELKLKFIAETLDEIMLDTSASDKPYSEYLYDLLDMEIQHRRSLAIEKRLRVANFPTFDKHLDINGYDFGCRNGISKRQIIEISNNLIWIDKAYNIMLLGGSGLGKSFLASYIGFKAIECGYNVIYITLHNLTHLLRTENALSRSKSKMKRIRSCDLLVLDEVGNASLDRLESNLFFQLLLDFYQQTSIIAISNKGFEDWSRTFGDNVGTAAVMDRLLHNCEVFNISGDSWRIENQKTISKHLLKVSK